MDLKEVKERMQNGKLYFPTDEALLSEQAEYMEILYDFNNTRPSEGEKRAELLKKLLGGVGKTAMWSRLFMLTGDAIPIWGMMYTPISI